MIRDWNEHSLTMDFSSMFDGNDHPSDIDMFYIGKDEHGKDVLILGEIKNARGSFGEGQRRLLEKLANNFNGLALVLYITHRKDVHKGDKVMNVGNCYVEEYYYKGYSLKPQWLFPQEPTTVREVIEKYKRTSNERY